MKHKILGPRIGMIGGDVRVLRGYIRDAEIEGKGLRADDVANLRQHLRDLEKVVEEAECLTS